MMSGTHRATADHRTRPRRRGRALDEAIFQATLDELAERGYAKLTMEGVAARARAGKASLYRRWPTRVELVMDAVSHALPDPSAPSDTGSLRGDLLATLRVTAELLAGPAGEALRGVLSDVLRDPVHTARARRRSQGSGRRAMAEIARRAADRGEIDPAAITPRRLEAGLALLRQHVLFGSVPVPDEVIVEIVDEVVIPLLTAPPGR
jgi:AcrR family transcriptional regulator